MGLSFNKKISAAAIDLYPHDELSAETVELREIGSVEDQSLCEENHCFVPINNSDVNPGINEDDDEDNDDEN